MAKKKNQGADFDGHAFYECHDCATPCGLGVQLSNDKLLIDEASPSPFTSQSSGFCPVSGRACKWKRTVDASPTAVGTTSTG